MPLGLVAPLDVPAIERVIPHRFPFLMIDRVVELSDDAIVAIKNVSANEPYFAGHFQRASVMPGVIGSSVATVPRGSIGIGWQRGKRMRAFTLIAALASAASTSPWTVAKRTPTLFLMPS